MERENSLTIQDRVKQVQDVEQFSTYCVPKNGVMKKGFEIKSDLIVAKLAKYSGGRCVGREGVTGMRSNLRSELNSRASNESTPRKYSLFTL